MSTPVVVATSFTAGRAEATLYFAKDLAKRLVLPLRIVHVGPPPAGAPESLLAGIRRALGADVPLEVVTLPDGDVVSALVCDAAECGAALIVAGAHTGSRWVPAGASIIKTLIEATPIPVLIHGEGSTIDLTSPGLRLLAVDDPTEPTRSTLRTALALATRLGAVRLMVLTARDDDGAVAGGPGAEAVIGRIAQLRQAATQRGVTVINVAGTGDGAARIVDAQHALSPDLTLVPAELLPSRTLVHGDLATLAIPASASQLERALAGPMTEVL